MKILLKKFLIRALGGGLLLIFVINIFNLIMEFTSGEFYQNWLGLLLLTIIYIVPVSLFIVMPTIFYYSNKTFQVLLYSFLSFIFILFIFYLDIVHIDQF